jgi:hypothetical protein
MRTPCTTEIPEFQCRCPPIYCLPNLPPQTTTPPRSTTLHISFNTLLLLPECTTQRRRNTHSCALARNSAYYSGHSLAFTYGGSTVVHCRRSDSLREKKHALPTCELYCIREAVMSNNFKQVCKLQLRLLFALIVEQNFDTLRAETYRIIEYAFETQKMSQNLHLQERSRLKQENIAKLEDKLNAYISMLNALDRE